jgi:solute carrier family 25 (mitochondrial uncoupling protein), member 8/9
MNTKRMNGEGDFAFFIRNVLMASTAAMTAEVATIPIDTAKVRLQIQTTKAGEAPRYSGIFGTVAKVAAEEGPLALWSGLVPGLQRQFVFAGLRVGLYVPVRDMITGPLAPGQNPTLLQKIAAGMTTGAIGISIANPTDVVKIRMQAQGRLPVAERPYKSSMDCYGKIIADKGVPGLWIGVVPNIMRNSIINAAELASYDQFK